MLTVKPRTSNKSTTSAPQRCQNLAKVVSAAFASPFNDRGVVAYPAKTITRPGGSQPQIEVEFFAHAVEGQWMATTCWHTTTGHLPGDGNLPHLLSARFKSETEAVKAAGVRMVKQIEATLGEQGKTPLWAAQIADVDQYVDATVEQVRATDQSLEMHGLEVIDLCAGIGAMAMGFTSKGAVVKLACEKDKNALAVYQKNMKPLATHDDVCTLDGRKLVCDILSIGMICTALSRGGKKLGFNDPILADVYRHLLRLMTEIHAKVVVIECAAELLTNGGGSAADAVRKTLMRAGYRVQHRTLDAVGFGVPQFRNRSFIVATRIGLPVDDLLGYVFPTEQAPTARVKDIIDWSVPGHIEASEIVFSKLRKTKTTARRMKVGHIDGKKYQGYRVMSTEGLGATLTATGGGRARCTEAYLINGKARGLTPREACRMQGLPEWFEHHASPSQALKQAGNAVAVPLIRELANQLTGLLRPNA